MTRVAQTRIGIWPVVILIAALAGGLGCREEEEDATTDAAASQATEASTGESALEEITVRFLIAGLTAFVPTEDGASLSVLAIDAAQNYKTHTGCEVPGHEAVLEWEAGGCTGCPSQPEDEADSNQWLHTLDREDIHVRLVGADSTPPALDLATMSKPLSSSVAKAPKPPLGPEWLFHMGELFGPTDYARIKNDCFQASPDSSKCPLVARLRLDHGTLSTCRFSAVVEKLRDGGREEKVSVFEFKPLPKAGTLGFTPRPLAHALQVEWKIRARGLEIWTTRFGDTGEGLPLKVSLEPNAQNEIVVGLFNRLPLDENGLTDFSDPKYCDMEHADPHFDHFYRIAKATPEPHPIPHHTTEFLGADVQPDCRPSFLPAEEVAALEPDAEDTGAKPPEHSSCVPLAFYPPAGEDLDP